ncbi:MULTISPECIES: hypothetical protein [unclassified Picosynechococcus]|uniref:hypothetical protein n=1 Tax=unclassified Picosynechococcus TaxID=3079910 RepID=UPI0004AA2DD5|nr:MULTISPECIES: hypothetical protein [unclassified Picosynechococcus]ANV87211.1 hypothetical protein AWQ22_06905 [Picosynechococcus sp. PCC 7117]
MVYSTQDLIEILNQELKATLRGDRLLLSPDARVGVPIVTMALDQDQLGKVFACQDFTQQIHQYQRENHVSGIVWREISVGDRQLRLPEIHQQLIAIDSDKAILRAAKQNVLDFWHHITTGLNLWQLVDHQLSPLTFTELERASRLAEWAELDVGHGEFYLALCWGNPKECHYRWAAPKSGCDRLIAAAEQPQHLNIF